MCDAAVSALKRLPPTDDGARRGVDLGFDSYYGHCTYDLTVSMEIVVVKGETQVMVHAFITADLGHLLMQSPCAVMYTSYDNLIDEMEEEEFSDDGWAEVWRYIFVGMNIFDDCTVNGLDTTFSDGFWLHESERTPSDETDQCIACVKHTLGL